MLSSSLKKLVQTKRVFPSLWFLGQQSSNSTLSSSISARRWTSTTPDKPTPEELMLLRLEKFLALKEEGVNRQAERLGKLSEQGKRLTVSSPSGETIHIDPTSVETASDLPWIQSGHDVVAQVSVLSNQDGKHVEKEKLLWDLNRPLRDIMVMGKSENEMSISIKGLPFGTEDGTAVFWHSTAHILGHALELEYGMNEMWLSDGPPLEGSLSDDGLVGPGSGGFFYDLEFLKKPRHVDPAKLKGIQNRMMKAMKGNKEFERIELSQEGARDLFAYNPKKIEMIDKLTENGTKNDVVLTAYRCGSFVDLCRGPHVPHTGFLNKGIKVLDVKTIHEGLEERVYGISFPRKPDLKDWIARTEEASKRDHRKIGKRQELFMFHKLSPGSAFMLPHGTIVYNRLLTMLRDQYEKRGFSEVMTPLLYSAQLWKQSGHADNYQENMYKVSSMSDAKKVDNIDLLASNQGACGHTHAEEGKEGEAEEDMMSLKPMNCPGHCLVYARDLKSYRDLPVRLADFSALHRNEASGALGGMTRLRRFHQDDAHIFCTREQMHNELLDCIDFVRHVYEKLFDFRFRMRLSTRPKEKSIGEDKDWEFAEQTLENVLNDTGLPWQLDPGEGAFYGPKIDISVTDALGRHHQCATIQLDFQLPERFDLEYTVAGGERQRPVMIHRAVLGSVERFLAILIEHTNGKLPFWLSPRQVMILPVDPATHGSYASELAEKLKKCCCSSEDDAFLNNTSAAGLCVQVDPSNETLAKRVRTAQQAPFSVILVVGDDEMNNKTVTARSNDGTVIQTIPADELIRFCAVSVSSRANHTFPIPSDAF